MTLPSNEDIKTTLSEHSEKLAEHGHLISNLRQNVEAVTATQRAIQSAQESANATVHKIELALVEVRSAQTNVAAKIDALGDSLKVLIYSTAQESRAQLIKHERDEFSLQTDTQKKTNRNLAVMMSIGMAATIVILFILFASFIKYYLYRALQ